MQSQHTRPGSRGRILNGRGFGIARLVLVGSHDELGIVLLIAPTVALFSGFGVGEHEAEDEDDDDVVPALVQVGSDGSISYLPVIASLAMTPRTISSNSVASCLKLQWPKRRVWVLLSDLICGLLSLQLIS